MVQLHETGHAVETHKHGYSHLLGIKQYFVESVSGEPNSSVPLTIVTCVKRNVEGEKLTATAQDESARFQHSDQMHWSSGLTLHRLLLAQGR